MKRYIYCGFCKKWQVVTEEAFFDDIGTEFQECEFCETDVGPKLILVSGFDLEESQYKQLMEKKNE
jgi:hypothetical protein